MSGKSSCGKVAQKAIIIDSFAKPFRFMLPGGTKEYKSLIGAIFTLITTFTVLGYAVYKWQLLLEKDDTVLAQTIIEDHFIETDRAFGSEEGFQIAFGLYGEYGCENQDEAKIHSSSLNRNRNNICLNEEYGNFTVYNVQVSSNVEERLEVKYHKC